MIANIIGALACMGAIIGGVVFLRIGAKEAAYRLSIQKGSRWTGQITEAKQVERERNVFHETQQDRIIDRYITNRYSLTLDLDGKSEHITLYSSKQREVGSSVDILRTTEGQYLFWDEKDAAAGLRWFTSNFARLGGWLGIIGASLALLIGSIFQISQSNLISSRSGKIDLQKKGLSSLGEYREKFRKNPDLRELRLSTNQLSDLPEEIGALSKLESLKLDSNKFSVFPPGILRLNNLHTLFIQKNLLKRLPENFGELSKLKILLINQNQLESLPDSIGNLTNLKTLNAHSNKLQSLPASFAALGRLKSVHLQKNKLLGLPGNFGDLKTLDFLNLGGNQLKSLPPSFQNLKNLTYLDLAHNKFKSIPRALLPLKKLKFLNLKGHNFPETERKELKEALKGVKIIF